MQILTAEDLAEALEALKPWMTECCDASLADWQDSANSGAWVKFRLPDETHLEIYRGKNRSGRGQRWGQRYTMILIEIADDETPIKPERNHMEQKEVKPMTLPQMSGYFCTLEDFRLWLRETYGAEVNSTETAAIFVRDMCNIESRRDLLTNEAAATTFRKMAADYDEWKKARDASQPEAA